MSTFALDRGTLPCIIHMPSAQAHFGSMRDTRLFSGLVEDCQRYMAAASHILEDRIDKENHSRNLVSFYSLTVRDPGIEKKFTFEEVAEAYVLISAGEPILAMDPKTKI